MCVVPHTDPVKNYKHVFDVCTADRVYHLSAESTEEKLAWVNTLKELIFPPKVTGHHSNHLSVCVGIPG